MLTLFEKWSEINSDFIVSMSFLFNELLGTGPIDLDGGATTITELFAELEESMLFWRSFDCGRTCIGKIG